MAILFNAKEVIQIHTYTFRTQFLKIGFIIGELKDFYSVHTPCNVILIGNN
jgi:hypothetical protein